MPTQFHSFTVRGVATPMHFFRDEDATAWVDLRSVLTALRVGWQRWGAYFYGRREMLGLRALEPMSLNSTLSLNNTLLATPLVMLAVLDHLRLLLPAGAQARRLEWFRDEWVQHWSCGAEDAMGESEIKSRKLTPDVVLSIFVQTQANRTSPQIARKLQMSESIVRLVRAGTYKSMDAACRAVWSQTFGGQGRYSALLAPAEGDHGA